MPTIKKRAAIKGKAKAPARAPKRSRPVVRRKRIENDGVFFTPLPPEHEPEGVEYPTRLLPLFA